MNSIDTICAISTPPGQGGIAVIRLSGAGSLAICDKVFTHKIKSFKIIKQKPNTIHYGNIVDDNEIIDDVLVSVFLNPSSYTGEDVVEISCHGSSYIQQKILDLLIKKGARLAKPGEFTMRAFMNGKMDLSQAEAVADLIGSQTETSHRIAMEQMRGGFSNYLKQLRSKLLNFTSLIELELDFSEEDVEFANRGDFKKLLEEIEIEVKKLLKSFELGNVIKSGIPIIIAGNPNVGKSTLLNTILNEEKAIVSEIPGTTRDTIEDVLNIKGVAFRFIDTAGIRETSDEIETMGINRTFEKMKQARVIMYMADAADKPENIIKQVKALKINLNQQLYILLNKKDKLPEKEQVDKLKSLPFDNVILISAKDMLDVEQFLMRLHDDVIKGMGEYDNVIVSNARHAEALQHTFESVLRVQEGLKTNLSTDLLAVDIRAALHFLGEITGEITTDEVLGNIFKNFCIGK